MRLGKNSILGENEVDFPTIKRIVSRFSAPDTVRFLIINANYLVALLSIDELLELL